MSTLPDWLTPLPDAETMRAIDRWAIAERGVASLELMERAGAAVVRALERECPDGPVSVLCGKGNNGGDGLVVARLLRQAGREVTVVCVEPPQAFAGDALRNLERLPGTGPQRLDGTSWEGREGDRAQAVGSASADVLGRAAMVVDALLGTGFHGKPHGDIERAIEALDRCAAPILSIDIPSGVDASTGAVEGVAVSAALTVTLHADKPGLWIHPGKAHAGTVETVDIGIPRGAPLEPAIGLIEEAVVAELPRRTASWTKFRSGQVLVAGGSRGLTGAPTLACLAAMRAGAGYVTACVPSSLQQVLACAATPELMTRGLPEDEQGDLLVSGAGEAREALRKGGALVLGPGLGRAQGAVTFARTLAREAQAPMVLDADGLNAHAGRLEELALRAHPTVLTPHAGELARLLGQESVEIERARLAHVRSAAERCGAVVVLKGDDTLIAEAGGRVAVSRGGSPALATAGTGDVLSGVIAALLAQGLDGFTAAAAGVWLHAEAGRQAARRLGVVEGVIASDVIEALPGALASGRAGAAVGMDGAGA